MSNATLPRNEIIHSRITANGQLDVFLAEEDVPQPLSGQVVVEVEAAPINPSDIGVMIGFGDPATLEDTSTASGPSVRFQVPEQLIPMVKARLGQALPVGYEGAGRVVRAGAGAEHLLGRTVSVSNGAMYARYKLAGADECFVLPNDASPRDGAASFVNPLTALGMVETMRQEGHVALIHTAAASNLGQMLNRICVADRVPLVNVVRSAAQQEILRAAGSTFICDLTSPTVNEELVAAIGATRATIAFDAIGGGAVPNLLLNAMETVYGGELTSYSPYGSSIPKQVYVYGALDFTPIELFRGFGFTWAMGGWLLPNFLARVSPVVLERMRNRVAAELKTTFASHFDTEISLRDALRPDIIGSYTQRATGKKYLINPKRA